MNPYKDARLAAILSPLPPSWPATGFFRGHEIDLNVARTSLDPLDLADVRVDFPGDGPRYPWRGSEIIPDPQPRHGEPGHVNANEMTESSLRSLGLTDEQLAAQFRDAYGIAVDIVDARARRMVFDAVQRKHHE